MSAIAAIVINDGQATPVSHTFNPVNIDANGVAQWADRVGGIALGYPLVTVSVRPPSSKSTSRLYKVVAKVWTPILEVTSPSTASGIQPAPTKAFDLMCSIEFNLPERSSRLQRQDVYAFAKNVLAHATLSAAVLDFESIY